MSQSINLTISDNLTNNHPSVERNEPETVSYKTSLIPASTASRLSSSKTSYQVKLPSSFDPVSDALGKISSLRNAETKQKVGRILGLLRSNLAQTLELSESTNRLPKVHLTESEDDSALVEWNFQGFRIGFTIDAPTNSTSYHIISEDRTVDTFFAVTKRMDEQYQEVVSAIVNYVIANS